MSIPYDRLLALLPALYRERDAEVGGALAQYLEVLTDELAVVADGIDQLYDDQFVETAAPWVLPYLADLIGLRGLPGADTSGLTSRAEVANTIAYRRRKGTAAVLEQVARDTTGWPARAVEFFELLAGVQHVNHARPRARATVSVRGANRLEFLGTAFERGRAQENDLVHLPEMRRISSRRGRYNLPNVGIFLWRLRSARVTNVGARPVVPGDRQRFLLDPLGLPVQLFTDPVTEVEITHFAEPLNVPLPISRRMLGAAPESYYGTDLSVAIRGVPAVEAADLRDLPDGSGDWAHPPDAGQVLLDPVLGRVAFGDPQGAPPVVTYHRGCVADLGGGEYDRVETFAAIDGPVVTVAAGGGADHPTIAAAVAALPAKGGVVEILDNATYAETPVLTADAAAVELRAGDGRRPVLETAGPLVVTLAGGGAVSINGLVVAGAVHVTGDGEVALRHCTLVPRAESLNLGSGGVSASVERSVVGGVRSHPDAEVALRDSIVDAGIAGVAYASPGAVPAGGGPLTVDACTLLGRVHARILDRLSNAIVLGDGVLADQRQRGCVRFSSLPAGSRTPRRHRCVPGTDLDAARLRPVLVSARYGHPAYGQLDRRTPDAVRRGADDGSEMGAFHHLQQPRREAYLEARLADYLRFGLEAGLFLAT